jgi:hypothetical protein
VFQPLLKIIVRQSPPSLNGEVPRLRPKHRECVAKLEAEVFVLVLQGVRDIEFGVFLQRLGPMELAGSLVPVDGNLRISRPVDNLDDILIGLRTVRHEVFEVRLGDAMASHDVVEVMLEKHSSILVLGLEVAASHGLRFRRTRGKPWWPTWRRV